MIRDLKVKDVRWLSSLLLKLVDKVNDDSILNMISSAQTVESKEENSNKILELGISLITKLSQTATNEMTEWFADLSEKKVEEYLELPFDTDMKIIDAIVNKKEFDSFFMIASRLYKRTKTLSDRLNGAKT